MEQTNPGCFWMQMERDRARSFVSIAKKMGHSIWIDETVKSVTVWPNIYDEMRSGRPGLPAKITIRDENVPVFCNEDIKDYTPVWREFERIHDGH